MSMQYVVKGKITRATHDLACPECDHVQLDMIVNPNLAMPPCPRCSNVCMNIRLDLSTRRSNVTIDPNISPRDRAIVYINPKTGKPAIPGQDTEFTRRKYEGWGYERREFETLRELDKFCKQEKLVNEKANYDNGNGIN